MVDCTIGCRQGVRLLEAAHSIRNPPATCVIDVNQHTKELVKDVVRFLAYHKSAGIDSYPESEELRRLLQGEYDPGSKPSPPTRRPAMAKEKGTEERVAARDESAAVPAGSAGKMEELAAEIGRCHACSLSTCRVIPVAGAGGSRCGLLIVGDWLSVERPGQLPENCQFGLEQDRMLGRMLQAMKMDRSEVFVTNVIKCGIPSAKQPQAAHVTTCVSYLHSQITLLKPRLILAMGLIAARSLLNRREPLSRLRGRLHSYQDRDGNTIPLVATYHPTFLLQNEGMKKATWIDLQLAARHLAQGTDK